MTLALYGLFLFVLYLTPVGQWIDRKAKGLRK